MLKILVVDDNELELQRFCEILSPDYDVITAQHGMEAYQKLQQNNIGLLILDQNFEKIEDDQLVNLQENISIHEQKVQQGLYILDWLRNQQKCEVITIFCTSEDNYLLGKKALVLGAWSYHSKNKFYNRKQAKIFIENAISSNRQYRSILNQLAKEVGVEIDSPMDMEMLRQKSIWRVKWPKFCRDFLEKCLQQYLLPVNLAADVFSLWQQHLEICNGEYERLTAQDWAEVIKNKLCIITGVLEYQGKVKTSLETDGNFYIFHERLEGNSVTWLLLNPEIAYEENFEKWKNVCLPQQNVCLSDKEDGFSLEMYNISLGEKDPFIAHNFLIAFRIGDILFPQINYQKQIQNGWITAQDLCVYMETELVTSYNKLREVVGYIWQQFANEHDVCELPFSPEFLWIPIVDGRPKLANTRLLALDIQNLLPGITFAKKSYLYNWFYLSFNGFFPDNFNVAKNFFEKPELLERRFKTYFCGQANSQEMLICTKIQQLAIQEEIPQSKILIIVNPTIKKLSYNREQYKFTGRETDVIAITPYGIYVIEAKSSRFKKDIERGISQCYESRKDLMSFIKTAFIQTRKALGSNDKNATWKFLQNIKFPIETEINDEPYDSKKFESFKNKFNSSENEQIVIEKSYVKLALIIPGSVYEKHQALNFTTTIDKMISEISQKFSNKEKDILSTKYRNELFKWLKWTSERELSSQVGSFEDAKKLSSKKEINLYSAVNNTTKIIVKLYALNFENFAEWHENYDNRKENVTLWTNKTKTLLECTWKSELYLNPIHFEFLGKGNSIASTESDIYQACWAIPNTYVSLIKLNFYEKVQVACIVIKKFVSQPNSKNISLDIFSPKVIKNSIVAMRYQKKVISAYLNPALLASTLLSNQQNKFRIADIFANIISPVPEEFKNLVAYLKKENDLTALQQNYNTLRDYLELDLKSNGNIY